MSGQLRHSWKLRVFLDGGLYIRHHKPTGIRCAASVLGTMREVNA
jgi:hypothetical protein